MYPTKYVLDTNRAYLSSEPPQRRFSMLSTPPIPVSAVSASLPHIPQQYCGSPQADMGQTNVLRTRFHADDTKTENWNSTECNTWVYTTNLAKHEKVGG